MSAFFNEWVPEFPEPTPCGFLCGFRSFRNPRPVGSGVSGTHACGFRDFQNPHPVGSGISGTHACGFRSFRNPHSPPYVGSAVLGTHAFLEFHFPGLCWHTVLGFGCSKSFTFPSRVRSASASHLCVLCRLRVRAIPSRHDCLANTAHTHTWKMRGEKKAAVIARPRTPEPPTSAQARGALISPAATGRNGLFTLSISTS